MLKISTTYDCSNNCKHCYMKKDSPQKELHFEDFKKILKSVHLFEKKYNYEIDSIMIGGGDPLMRKDWQKFFSEIRTMGKEIILLATPETLTDENIQRLLKFDIKEISLSLDGMQKKHDFIRYPGSFKKTVESIDRLAVYGIKVRILFTLFDNNYNDLVPLINYINNKTKSKIINIGFGCHSGNASQYQKRLTDIQVKSIVQELYLEKKRLEKENPDFIIKFSKQHLFDLLDFENNEKSFIPPSSTDLFSSGCNVGFHLPTIQPNGSLTPCALMGAEVGKMPEQSFEEIFLGNKLLKKLRRYKYYKKCSKCDFSFRCKGCACYSWGVSKDPFAKDPLCFRDSIKRKIEHSPAKHEEPSIDTTFEEEWKFILKHNKKNNFFNHPIMKKSNYKKILISLCRNDVERKLFLKEPSEYLQEKNISLSRDGVFLLMKYLNKNERNLNNPRLKNILLTFLEV